MNSILGAAAAGMQHHATMLDVVANNLANANTGGFLASRVVAEGAPNATGEGARSGVSQTTIDRVMAAGSFQPTQDPLHVAVQDDAFFRLQDLDGTIAYTRFGGFSIDASRSLILQGGRQLDPPVAIPDDHTSPSIDAAGVVSAVDPTGIRVELARIPLVRFGNPRGLESLGSGLYRQTVNAGVAVQSTPGDDGFATLAPGVLESSNVELATEFTNMLIAQRAYQANVRAFSIGDEMLAIATDLTR